MKRQHPLHGTRVNCLRTHARFTAAQVWRPQLAAAPGGSLAASPGRGYPVALTAAEYWWTR